MELKRKLKDIEEVLFITNHEKLRLQEQYTCKIKKTFEVNSAIERVL